VDTIGRKDTDTVRAYAEVWGTDHTGLEYVPVAWIQNIADVVVNPLNDKLVLEMQIHKNWIQLAKAGPPFRLRNVEIQDVDTSIGLSQRSDIFVEMTPTELKNLMTDIDYSVLTVITEEMEKGPRPLSLRKSSVGAPNDPRKMLLVHGYCAGSNEFPPSQFDNSVQFADFKQSRSNDAFSLELKKLIDTYPQGVSIVGHSQGGLAALHLHSYYWSNLDIAVTDGGRLIQSVGSPYQGTSLAGFLADLGWVFGLGCGSNYDLSRDGAVNWLSKVPLNARGDLYYYTTQYEDYWWILPNNCVTAANVILAKPNDGTTEERYAQVTGAHSARHIDSWCHTNGMKYPAQCKNANNNAEMNRLAAKH